MNLVAILLDVGNIIFFIASFPQLITAYKNRKNLKALSKWMLIGYTFATACFAGVGYLANAPLTLVFNIFNTFLFLAQIYWKWKYGK